MVVYCIKYFIIVPIFCYYLLQLFCVQIRYVLTDRSFVGLSHSTADRVLGTKKANKKVKAALLEENTDGKDLIDDIN